MKSQMIGYHDALRLTLETVPCLQNKYLPLLEALDAASAENMHGRVASPSVTSSLKDGYAVQSEDICNATPDTPVRLKVVGTAAAGGDKGAGVNRGESVRILTGAGIPEGADAVVSEEFTCREGDDVMVNIHAEPGRNIFRRGDDVAIGDLICKKGDRMTPGLIGLLAAAGYHEISVFKRPKVSLIATGDEILIPGAPLIEGKLYASNLATLTAWCRRYGMETEMAVVRDDERTILRHFENVLPRCDALLTSGGAWTGDRDLVVKVLNTLGWKQYFHRIRIGPGKAVGFGILQGKPVFVLPGGPPSNLLAFLTIALPGLLKMSGFNTPDLPQVEATVKQTVKVRNIDWTQFIFGKLVADSGQSFFEPYKLKSRLQSMAHAKGIIAVPEGELKIEKGSRVSVRLLS